MTYLSQQRFVCSLMQQQCCTIMDVAHSV